MSKTYNFCPLCGSNLVDKTLNGHVKRACDKCDYVHWNNPLPVVAAVIPHVDGGLVLVKRAMPPCVGDWALPAGFVDTDEDPAHAVVREAKEECSLDIEIEKLLVIHATPANQMLLVYLAKPVSAQPVFGDDASDAQVFTKDKLPANIAFSLHRGAIDTFFAGQ